MESNINFKYECASMRYRGIGDQSRVDDDYFPTSAPPPPPPSVYSGSGSGAVDCTIFLSICTGILLAAVVVLGIVGGIQLNTHSSQIDDLSPGPVGPEGPVGPTGRVASLTEPCNCTAGECTDGFEWHSLVDRVNYACNRNASQWWSTESHDSWGEAAQGTPCQIGEDPSDRDACAVAWGKGEGPSNQRIGKHFLPNWVITSISYADDGDANNQCTTGADTYQFQMWCSSAPVSINFTLFNILATEQNSSRVVVRDLNVPVTGDMYVTFGILNNCSGQLSDFVLSVYYRLTPVSYV